MTLINGEEIVPQQLRDQIFKQLRSHQKNNICIDCQKKNPKWTSLQLGIYLCIDCAGKHRQYGVMYSFVKSTNFDKWNRKQLLFMQKGGNQKAFDYFIKCGVINQTYKHIDYKSPIVQRYKALLTSQVQLQLNGKSSIIKQLSNKKQQNIQQQIIQKNINSIPKQIPHAQLVQNQDKGKKKNKKKIGTKIFIQNFDNIVLDDGVPIDKKQKINKNYQTDVNKTQTQSQQKSQNPDQQTQSKQPQQSSSPPPPDQKQMSSQQAKQKLDQLATQKVKSISSQSFKDTTTSNDAVKQKLTTQLSTKQNISNTTLFGNGTNGNQEGSMDKIKGFVSDAGQKIYDASQKIYDAGGKIYNKLSSYWSKK